jgi:hypothetical protein
MIKQEEVIRTLSYDGRNEKWQGNLENVQHFVSHQAITMGFRGRDIKNLRSMRIPLPSLGELPFPSGARIDAMIVFISDGTNIEAYPGSLYERTTALLHRNRALIRNKSFSLAGISIRVIYMIPMIGSC